MFHCLETRHPEPPWDDLDPGVVWLVRLMHEAGFPTTDSGDGRSKADAIAAGDALPFAHVFAVVEPRFLFAEADRLQRVLRSSDIEDPSAWKIEGTYDPDDRFAVLGVYERIRSGS